MLHQSLSLEVGLHEACLLCMQIRVLVFNQRYDWQCMLYHVMLLLVELARLELHVDERVLLFVDPRDLLPIRVLLYMVLLEVLYLLRLQLLELLLPLDLLW